MRLKSFYAKTMTEAMQLVRDTLGEDAVIVATREENGGKAVRVTAAVEQVDHYEDEFATMPARGDLSDNTDEGLMFEDSTDNESEMLEKLTDVMLRHAVPEEIIDQVISCATVIGLEQADIALIAALEHLFSYKSLPVKPTATAYMMVGQPGSGKTLSVAKLATRAVMNDLKVAVITTDTVRAGGVEQLAAFTKLLNIKLRRATNPQELRQVIDACSSADQIYIDTAGTNPFNAEEMRTLAKLMTAGNIEPLLAMPAGADADESGEIARAFATLGVTKMMATRLDIARRLGGLLGAAHSGGLIFADASNTPKVADGLIGMSPKRLAYLLMPEAVKKQRKESVQTRKETVFAG